MSRRVLGLALAAALAGGAPAGAFQHETTDDAPCAEAPGVNCAHHGTPLFWGSKPVRYLINAAGSGSTLDVVRGAIDAAFATWQGASGGDITFEFAGQSNGGSDGQDGKNTISWQHLASARDTFAQTIITFDSKSGEIFDSDTEFNSSFPFGVLPTGEDNPSDRTSDIQAVMTHEAGHALGLDHENRFAPEVVMYFEDTSGDTTHRSLTSDDQDGVQAIYSGGAASSGGGGGGGGGGCRLSPSTDATTLWPAAALLLGLLVRRRARRR